MRRRRRHLHFSTSKLKNTPNYENTSLVNKTMIYENCLLQYTNLVHDEKAYCVIDDISHVKVYQKNHLSSTVSCSQQHALSNSLNKIISAELKSRLKQQLINNRLLFNYFKLSRTLHQLNFKLKRIKLLPIQLLTLTGIFLTIIAFSAAPLLHARVINSRTTNGLSNDREEILHQRRHHYQEERPKTVLRGKTNSNGVVVVSNSEKNEQLGDVIVHTGLGKIRGFKQKFENSILNVYLGVPYALKPTETRRFRAPEPIKSWQGEFVATSASKTCYYTIDTMFPQFPGAEMWNPLNDLDEDCLSMNIWVPAEKHDGTVLVWIYGGGFFSGSPSLELYDGRVLAAQKHVIVININYRLGAFGFLYFGRHSPVPGNMGLLDQQLALKWIYENVAYFGGDPRKITLFGESAGGTSCSAHLFAPGSQNYFNKLILKSGTVLNNWATKSTNVMLEISMSLAKRLNCTNEIVDVDSNKHSHRAVKRNHNDNNQDTKAFKLKEETLLNNRDVEMIVNCMSRIPASVLEKKANEISESLALPMTFAFVPVDEDENFFQGNLFKKIRKRDFKKDVSIIVGSVKDEGTYWLPYYLHKFGFAFNHTISSEDYNNQALITEFDYMRSFDAFLPYFGNSPLVRHALMHAYARFNLPPNEHNHNNYHSTPSPSSSQVLLIPENNGDLNHNIERWRNGVARFLGDYFFTCSLVEFSDIMADNIFNSVYMYYFTKRSTANPWPKWMGIMHGYEIEYAFGLPFRLPQQYSSFQLNSEKQFSEKIMDFWTNFARTGKPVEYWPKYNRITRKSLVLSDEIANSNSHKIYVDVHGKHCRLLSEAQNFAAIEYRSKQLGGNTYYGFDRQTSTYNEIVGDESQYSSFEHLQHCNKVLTFLCLFASFYFFSILR